MQVLPVLDLLKGQVVRGIAGDRANYRPIVSRWTNSSEPAAVASMFREVFGLKRLYVADLDAIGGGKPAEATYRSLIEMGHRLWVDPGAHSANQVHHLRDIGVEAIIAGLETIDSPIEIKNLGDAWGFDRIVFSLDMRGGQVLGDPNGWRNSTPEGIAVEVIEMGVDHIILLDLERVGVSTGTGTETLATRILASHPHVKLVLGGGIRGLEDLKRIQALGAWGVLIASALHDGEISKADLEALTFSLNPE